MNILPFLVDHTSKEQWDQLVDLILTPSEGDSFSIWSFYLSRYEVSSMALLLTNSLWEEHWELNIFLRCVSERLGDTAVQ